MLFRSHALSPSHSSPSFHRSWSLPPITSHLPLPSSPLSTHTSSPALRTRNVLLLRPIQPGPAPPAASDAPSLSRRTPHPLRSSVLLPLHLLPRLSSPRKLRLGPEPNLHRAEPPRAGLKWANFPPDALSVARSASRARAVSIPAAEVAAGTSGGVRAGRIGGEDGRQGGEECAAEVVGEVAGRGVEGRQGQHEGVGPAGFLLVRWR